VIDGIEVIEISEVRDWLADVTSRCRRTTEKRCGATDATACSGMAVA
jgi:hypothetical protein